MGWEKTVLEWVPEPQILPVMGEMMNRIILKQAEVSYKAGEEAGYQRALRHFDIIKASEETPEEVV